MTARLFCQCAESTDDFKPQQRDENNMNTLLFLLCSDGILLLQPLAVSCLRLICPETALKSQNHRVMVFLSLLRQLSRVLQYTHMTIQVISPGGREKDKEGG